jgi:hypothetical protein
MQQYVAALRQKQAHGTITAEEQDWLKQAEQRGGLCITGTPRGPRAGKGQGAGQCPGDGVRQRLRDGTGATCPAPTCPNGNVDGVGLGLSLAREIVRAHRGDLVF